MKKKISICFIIALMFPLISGAKEKISFETSYLKIG